MITIVFALEYEGAALREPTRMCTSVWNLGITGKRCLGPLDRHLKRTKPSLIVSAGFSGGLQNGLPVGTIIVGDNASCSHVVRCLPEAANLTFGKLITTDNIIDTSSEKRALGESSGALAVDCETQHIREACESHEIPMLAVRCISDTVDQNLPVPGHILINPITGRPDPFNIFKYILTNPSSISGFRELVRNSRISQKSLSDSLSTLIPSLLRIPPV